MLIVCQHYVLGTSIDQIKENGFTQKKNKSRSRRYPAETIIDEGYANDLALLVNTSAQAESLLHSQKHTVGGIGLHVNNDKKEYLSLNGNPYPL